MTDFSADKQRLTDLVQDDSSDHNTSQYEHKDMYWGGTLVWGFLLFFIIFIIVFLIIFSLQPTSVFGEDDFEDGEDGERLWGKALLWAFVVAILILILIVFLYAISGYTASDC